MEGGEDLKQKEGTRERQVLSTVKGIYGGRRHMGEQGESKECRGLVTRI